MLIRTHPFTAEIVNLAVDPAYQRRGIGTDLIFHALRVTREAGEECRDLVRLRMEL